MDDLLREFLTETSESLDTVDNQLVRFEQDPNNAKILDNIFRLVRPGEVSLDDLERAFRETEIEVTPAPAAPAPKAAAPAAASAPEAAAAPAAEANKEAKAKPVRKAAAPEAGDVQEADKIANQ